MVIIYCIKTDKVHTYVAYLYGPGRGAFTAGFPKVDPVRAAGFISRCDLLQKMCLIRAGGARSGVVFHRRGHKYFNA